MFKSIKGPLIYTLINIIGSFLPLIMVVLLAKVFDDRYISLTELTGKGEITIICIPLCLTVIFTLYQYKKDIGINKIVDFLYGINVIILILAIGVYSYGIKVLTEPKQGLVSFSFFLLLWTTFILFYSKKIEDSSIGSLKNSRNGEQNYLETKFKNSIN